MPLLVMLSSLHNAPQLQAKVTAQNVARIVAARRRRAGIVVQR